MKRITAVVKSAEEITGVNGIATFTTKDSLVYNDNISDFAGERVDVKKIKDSGFYAINLNGAYYNVPATWLKDISEDVDW